MTETLDIIIVNWNSGDQLRNCLDSVVRLRGETLLSRVVIVDNGSSDNSLAGLDELPLPLTVLRNHDNRGFGAACNQGASGSKADYLLFLNPDAELLRGSLALPLAFMGRPDNAHVGVCGIQLLSSRDSSPDRVARTCARVPTAKQFLFHTLGLDRVFPLAFPSHLMTEWNHSDSRPVGHVMGAFFLVRAKTFSELRGFDEDYFVYLEDLDFTARASRRGYGVYYLAAARAFHKGGGTSEQVKARRLSYSLASRVIYSWKHFSRPEALGVILATVLLEPWIRLADAATRGAWDNCTDIARAYIHLPGELRGAIARHAERAASTNAST